MTIDRTNAVKRNPLYDILATCKVLKVEPVRGLHRIYYLDKTKKALKMLKAAQSVHEHLSRLDHNRVLDHYPECEYIFGPFVDGNEYEFNLVYLLYTNRINQPNEIVVLYAGTVWALARTDGEVQWLPEHTNEELYLSRMDREQPITGKLSNNCYYRTYVWSEDERRQLLEIYKAKSLSAPRYNTLRENFVCGMTLADGATIGANAYRFLYELNIQERLPAHVVVSPINGKKADLRRDNVQIRDLQEEDTAKRREVLENWGLDTHRLEQIYAKIGLNRFRGLYTHNEDGPNNGLRGRRYVKLVKNGTDEQHAILLSRALMTVKLDRILSDDETVDHIDHDNSNDHIDNLRVVSRGQNSSGDSVKVEVDPCACSCCGKDHLLSDKEFFYQRTTPSALVACSPQCRKELAIMDKQERVGRAKDKNITYRYYANDKDTGQRWYFPELDYDACRKRLFDKGREGLSTTPFPETIG